MNIQDGEQNITLSKGIYKIEVWGAKGGDAVKKSGGYGGYSVGEINLENDTQIFINVGGAGKTIYNGWIDGGYNGGGKAYSIGGHYTEGSGGGATHIALMSGQLKDLSENRDKVLIVAGGGRRSKL